MEPIASAIPSPPPSSSGGGPFRPGPPGGGRILLRVKRRRSDAPGPVGVGVGGPVGSGGCGTAAPCPERIELPLSSIVDPCRLSTAGGGGADGDGGGNRKRRKLAEAEEAELIRRLGSTCSLRSEGAPTTPRGDNAAVAADGARLPTARTGETSMELANGEISFPNGDGTGSNAAGSDPNGAAADAAAGHATPPGAGPRPGSGASSLSTATPRKPRRSVMFRRITGRRLHDLASAAGQAASTAAAAPPSPGSADWGDDEMTGISTGLRTHASDGRPHANEDATDARDKWLRVIDVKLEDRDRADGGSASPPPPGGEHGGAGRLNRRARAHSAGDADDGDPDGGRRPRRKRRRLAMVVEGSATVLESDFYAPGGGIGAADRAKTDGPGDGGRGEDGANKDGDGTGGEYYYETYCLDDSSLLRLLPSGGTSDVPDLERASGLGDEDDSSSSRCSRSGSDGALVEEFRGGPGAFGYWTEDGELVVESGRGTAGRCSGRVSTSGGPGTGGTRLFHSGGCYGDEDMDGNDEEEHDSNDEGYGGNDYPDDDDEDGSHGGYEDYRDADDYADFSDSDDEDGGGGGGPGVWRTSFRGRFVDRSSLNY